MLLLEILFVSKMVFANHAAEAEATKNWGGQESMNGYSLKDYADFDKKWKLVTVRYRLDSGEQRFIYANDIAWKAFESNATQFPEGSVFAKVAFKTEEDNLFPSSIMPSSSRRFQLMVKDSKKHQSTDGWGYALYDSNGLTFPENPQIQEVACHACHKLAAPRDFVFALPIATNPFEKINLGSKQKADEKSYHFVQIEKSELPPRLAGKIPKIYKLIESLQGPLQKFLFQGTLDEVRPLLIKRVSESGNPALLMNDDKSRYVLIYPDKKASCSNEKTHGYRVVVTMKVPQSKTLIKNKLIENLICQ